MAGQKLSVEVHTSELSAFKHCRRKWAFSELAGLRPKKESPALVLGTGVHVFMEVYYATDHNFAKAMEAYEDYCAQVVEDINAKYPDLYPEQEDALRENFELGCVMLSGYREHYTEDDFRVCKAGGKPLVEVRFRTPIFDPDGNPTGHYYGGTIDLIKRDEVGIWLGEHKTAKDIVTTHLRKDEQATMYMAYAQVQWPKLQTHLRGVHYNFLRKRGPSTRLKTPLFHRERVYRNQFETEKAVRQVYYVLEEMLRVANDPDNLALIAPDDRCGWKCSYRQLCQAIDDGTDVRWLIEADYAPERESRNYFPVCWLTEE